MCIQPRVDYFTWKCPGKYWSFESYFTLLKYRAASSSSLLTTKTQSVLNRLKLQIHGQNNNQRLFRNNS